jgi:hypothetical protein
MPAHGVSRALPIASGSRAALLRVLRLASGFPALERLSEPRPLGRGCRAAGASLDPREPERLVSNQRARVSSPSRDLRVPSRRLPERTWASKP